jgi:hypothetical protein
VNIVAQAVKMFEYPCAITEILVGCFMFPARHDKNIKFASLIVIKILFLMSTGNGYRYRICFFKLTLIFFSCVIELDFNAAPGKKFDGAPALASFLLLRKSTCFKTDNS